MEMLIVPSVSVEFSTLIAEVDAPKGVDNPAISEPFCEILNACMISPIETPKPKGSSTVFSHVNRGKYESVKEYARMKACTLSVFATGAQGSLSLKARSILPI